MSKKILTIMILSTILFFFGCKEKNEPEKSKEDVEFEKFLEESGNRIKEFKNRKIYKKLTSQILDSIPDDKLEQTIFDNIYEIIGEDYQNELKNVKKLTKGQQAFFSTWILEGEVNNGGFNQFYFNSSGQYAEMAKIGLKTIGAEKFSELTKRANKIFNENKERIEEFDDGTMESFSESYKGNPLNDLDTEFYKLYELEKIGDLRIKYIRENKNEFTTK
ncbi:DMP19 family protein [Winogradskyella immobilis]|uniref:DMP19 family protein n=1 Tax=Winogradskyella immobilis TaxID=2816852 RepID=A0ABS8ESU4_9FLAO|nr:DMP19 family protein [Winogradskyella immobilis]MCC1485585.1 DMP19 family protein [Winogradskyella immobilis]MCG0017677.1 DMP19 family protein [Winogradskyella immobilis]